MKKRLLFILLLVLPVVSANQVNYNHYSDLELKFELSSRFYMQQKASNYDIDYVESNLHFFPRQDPRQDVLSSEFFSDPSITPEKDETVQFRWENPSSNQFYYGILSKIKTKNILSRINEKIEFPQEIADYDIYLKPTDKIDLNDEIREQANKLAEGKDDYYQITFDIADWVEANIKYDLSTLTAEVVQKSSWVLEHKEGVCDELTNLFISMVRSLGIPAKFIYGMAYSNVNDAWGAHAWAEVYFPDKGWVPFDVTYGQFGWVDPTHIKLMESHDSNEPSIEYNWKSYNVDFVNDKITLSTSLTEKGQIIAPLVELRVKPIKDNVGPGSYVPIQASIKNLQDFYLPDSLYVTKAPELNEKNVKRILLKPYEEKTIYWIAKLPETIDANYEYKTLLEVQDSFHAAATEEISYSMGRDVISKSEAESLVKSLDIEEEKTYSKEISLACTTPKDYVYTYETLIATCSVKNKGTAALNNVEVCFKENCKNINLNLGETKKISFEIKDIPISTTKLKFSAKTSNMEVNSYISLNVIDNPELNVMNFDPPATMDYKDSKNLEFTLSAKAQIKNLKIKMNNKLIYEFEEFTSPQSISISSLGKEFAADDEISFYFEYYDENDKFYKKREVYPIKIINSPFYINIIRSIKSLF